MKAGHVGKRCHKFQVQRVTQAKKKACNTLHLVV